MANILKDIRIILFEPSPFETLISRLSTLKAYLVCSIRGHVLIDEGYAGPDSGSIDLVCQRCGYSYHHQLY